MQLVQLASYLFTVQSSFGKALELVLDLVRLSALPTSAMLADQTAPSYSNSPR